jgi:hypothetical protein
MNLGNACSGFDEAVLDELKAIAAVQLDAGGLVIRLSSWFGDKAKVVIDRIPEGIADKLDEIVELALRTSYAVAASSQADETVAEPGWWARRLASAKGDRWHTIASSVTGAAGGAGGVLTTAADLAATTTLTLRSIQQIAVEHGEDITQEEVRLECLKVFGFGSPMSGDDEAETGLFATRMALTGSALHDILKVLVPRVLPNLTPKIIAQSVPLAGAVVGAAINPVFVSYYQEMAHVIFRLRRLERDHDPEQVRACYERVVTAQKAATKKKK